LQELHRDPSYDTRRRLQTFGYTFCMSSGSKQLIAILLLMLIFIAAYWYEQRRAPLTRSVPSSAKGVMPEEKEVAQSGARTSSTNRPAQPPSTTS
jgi:hypothetical protein